ncbi:hypothetical protein LJR189_004792 [Acidovorax delafieldii]|uniref:hypothetical protein n=1 Tax=Acidovorax delafieldii TaxID=47920 RepID=UPI003ECCBB26
MNTATHISWADLARIKKAAKAAQTLPDLSYMQRLDALAASEFGVRHFHELQKRHEQKVAAHVEMRGGAHFCRYCDFTFSDFDKADRKQHTDLHHCFEEAESVMGFHPLGYKERESLKRAGHEQLMSEHGVTRRQGALQVILAHYDRSLMRAIEGNRWARHPYFLEYLPGALAVSTIWNADVLQSLVREFGERPGVIAKGDTDWPSDVTRQSRSDAGKLESMTMRQGLIAAWKASALLPVG